MAPPTPRAPQSCPKGWVEGRGIPLLNSHQKQLLRVLFRLRGSQESRHDAPLDVQDVFGFLLLWVKEDSLPLGEGQPEFVPVAERQRVMGSPSLSAAGLWGEAGGGRTPLKVTPLTSF